MMMSEKKILRQLVVMRLILVFVTSIQFYRPEREKGILNINRGKTKWIIYYMTPILIFLPLFCSLVLVIRSLQSMIFSLEYKIIIYLD